MIPFSVKHNKNKPTPYETYFLDAIGDVMQYMLMSITINFDAVKNLWVEFCIPKKQKSS